MKSFSDKQQWFALRVRSNCERIVESGLEGRGYPGFLPVYRRRSLGRRPAKNIELPLFPGYVFSSFDINNRLPILTVPGVVHIVGMGRLPEAIDREELLAIERFVNSGMAVEPWPYLQTGEFVLVERGPLSGLDGILLQIKKTQRLVISLTILKRSVAVEIDRDCVRPVKRPINMAQQSIGYRTASIA